jgi:hypothetical protein
MSATIDINMRARDEIQVLADKTGRPISSLAEHAIHTLYCAWVDDGSPNFGIPFKKRWSEKDADPVLRQADPTDFRLEEPFRFQKHGESDIVVETGDVTDLASVPRPLTWLVPRYGRHTLPAILHDHLVFDGMDLDDRERADTILRDSMVDTGVPFVRRWVMWAAVSLATQFKRSWLWKLPILVWLGLYVAVGFDLFFMVVRWWRVPLISWIPLPVVLISPIVLSLVWAKRYRLGLISAYNLFVLPVSVVAVGLTWLLYGLAEIVANGYLRLRFGLDAPVNPIRVSKVEAQLRKRELRTREH